MSYSEQMYNGHCYTLADEYFYVDDIGYKLPKKSKTHCLTTIGDKVYVNGYEFKDGQFKRTLKALWYKWF